MSADVEPPLRDDERIIRSDMVEVWALGQGNWWPETRRHPSHHISALPHLARMIITDKRVVFAPPIPSRSSDGLLRRVISPIFALFGAFVRRLPPVDQTEFFELGEIDSVHGWVPELSGPPMFQIGNDCWFFRLRTVRRKIASLDEKRAHFHAIREAWETAHTD